MKIIERTEDRIVLAFEPEEEIIQREITAMLYEPDMSEMFDALLAAIAKRLALKREAWGSLTQLAAQTLGIEEGTPEFYQLEEEFTFHFRGHLGRVLMTKREAES